MPRPLFERPIAHRGFHDAVHGVIENSPSAFEAAIVRDYAIECDVQLSRDGVPYIFHDDEFERLTPLTGPSNARDMAEIAATHLRGSLQGEAPQRFTEFLAQVAGRVLLQIELKQQPTPDATRMLAQTVLDALRPYRGPVTIESFDPQLLVTLRRRGATMPLGIVTYGYDVAGWDGALPPEHRFIRRHLLHWPMTRFDFVSCRAEDLDLPAVRFFRALGVPVTTWTIKSPGAALATVGKADQIVFEGFDPQGA